MKVLDAAKLERGTEIRVLNPHPLGGKTFRVTRVLDGVAVRICTDRGVVFVPGQIEVVPQPDLGALAAAADEAAAAVGGESA